MACGNCGELLSILVVFYDHIYNYLTTFWAQTSPTAPKSLLTELTVIWKNTNIKTDKGSVLMLLHLSTAFNTFYRRRTEWDCLTKCCISLSHTCTTGVWLQNSHNIIWSFTGVNSRPALVCILYFTLGRQNTKTWCLLKYCVDKQRLNMADLRLLTKLNQHQQMSRREGQKRSDAYLKFITLPTLHGVALSFDLHAHTLLTYFVSSMFYKIT